MRRASKHNISARTSSASWHRRRRFNKLFLQIHIYPLFRLLPVLWLLLCYCCCCCHCAHRRQSEEQIAQLSNCYDMQYGFDRALIGVAPKLVLPTTNSSNNGNGTSVTTANTSTAVSELWTRHPLHSASDVSTQGYRTATAMHTGWQCCCWNATNQVSIATFKILNPTSMFR